MLAKLKGKIGTKVRVFIFTAFLALGALLVPVDSAKYNAFGLTLVGLYSALVAGHALTDIQANKGPAPAQEEGS